MSGQSYALDRIDDASDHIKAAMIELEIDYDSPELMALSRALQSLDNARAILEGREKARVE